jgi:hypothetical protein
LPPSGGRFTVPHNRFNDLGKFSYFVDSIVECMSVGGVAMVVDERLPKKCDRVCFFVDVHVGDVG